MPQFITTGSALTVLSAILGICLTSWSIMVAAALICSRRAETASDRILTRPWRSFFLGLLVAAILTALGTALTGSPNPVAKLLGVLVYAVLFAMVATGAGGLALLVGQRVRQAAGDLSDYGALSRGATLIVLACLAPIVGWLVVTPAVLLISAGSGYQAMGIFRRRTSAASSVTHANSGAA